MQAGLSGPVQGVSGVSACLQELSSQGERIQQLMDQSNQSQSHGHSHSQSQPSHQHGMDDLLETFFNMSSWPEVGGKVNPWEYNSHSSMSMGLAENINPRLLMSLTPAGMGLGSQGTSYSSSVAADNLQMPSAYQDSILGSRQQQLSENLMGRVGQSECPASMVLQLGRSGNASPSGLGAIGVGGGSSRSMSPALLAATAMARSPSSAGSSGSDGGAASTIQSPTAQSWRPPSYGGGIGIGIGVGVHSQLPLTLGQGRLDWFPNETNLRGKRLLDEETTRPANTGLLTNFGSGQGIRPINQHALIRQNYGGAAQLQVPVPSGIATTPAPTLAPTMATGTMPARPRLRAKRGQATDPHSIAERQRRERITERMKALQDLVPSCSKTDRAAMLDEILDYVKFLQMQVKVLSMSRLGGAAAVAPLIATDTSSEGPSALGTNSDSQISSSDESLAIMERQVAKLMEEDMGSAMQYLQGKGLCVMPLSLAAAISSPSQPSILSSAPSISTANRTSTPPDRDESHNKKSMGAEAGTSTGGSGTDNPNGFNSAVKGGESRGGVSHQ